MFDGEHRWMLRLFCDAVGVVWVVTVFLSRARFVLAMGGTRLSTGLRLFVWGSWSLGSGRGGVCLGCVGCCKMIPISRNSQPSSSGIVIGTVLGR